MMYFASGVTFDKRTRQGARKVRVEGYSRLHALQVLLESLRDDEEVIAHTVETGVTK